MTHDAWIAAARKTLQRWAMRHNLEFSESGEPLIRPCMCAFCLNTRSLLEVTIEPCIKPAPVDTRIEPPPEWKQKTAQQRMEQSRK